MGQHTERASPQVAGRWWAFLLLFIGFIIKVPSVPLHTWLPDAHVEAPTPISMILAGVLLKMGGYGIIRICYPICPHGGYDLACTSSARVGVVSMVYGAFAALAQTDFKRHGGLQFGQPHGLRRAGPGRLVGRGRHRCTIRTTGTWASRAPCSR